MWNPGRITILGVVLAMAGWGAGTSIAGEGEHSTPSQVLDDYLLSLVSGNQPQISACIAGRMSEKNRQLVLAPGAYSRFLREYYAGVQTTVETMSPEGDGFLARVRFDYPASDSSTIVFELERVDGRWKIVDEQN